MAKKKSKEVRCCAQCGEPAEVLYCQKWYCGACLTPDPTPEYLQREREQVNGQWGGISVEAWNLV